MESSLLSALALGLLLGMRHALDADHVVAVSTLVSQYRNPFKSIWVGVSWGLGHTTTLSLAGAIILGLGLAMPERLSLFFELLVGVVLIFLGAQVFWSLRRRNVHLHPHAHEDRSHWHLHSHLESSEHAGHHELPIVGRPFFRLKSYVVGTIHGLAGSGALMLIALTAIKSTWMGVLYIGLFGLGSIISMGIITMFLGLPFSTSARLPSFNRWVQTTAGTGSVLFGAFLIYDIGIAGGLL